MTTNGSGEGMIKDDYETLSERVERLESRGTKLEDEVMCLKSALSDVIRRLKSQETEKPRSSNDKPSKASSVKSRVSMGSAPPRHTSHPVSNSTTVSKQSSKTSAQSARTQSTNSQSQSKAPVWDRDEGHLKIYLKGRPVSLYAPSAYADLELKDNPAPNEQLKLEWVYGYRGRDCRSNLFYLPTGEIVYFVAAIAVLYNHDEQTQRHYRGHTDDIKCMTVHPDKVHVATGQTAGHDKKDAKPHIRIWHSVSLNTIHVFGMGDFERSVACISFSKQDSGKYLVAVDESNDHNISVWDVSGQKQAKVTQTKSSADPVLAVEFHPTDKGSIITCGKNHIAFWTLDAGTLSKKNGLFDKYEKPKYILCLAFTDEGEVLSGDSSGNIYIWKRGSNHISRAITGAHDGGVFSILATQDGKIMSGGKDHLIIEWDNELRKTGQPIKISEQFGGVRVLTQRRGNMLLVGCTKNYILQGPRDFDLKAIVFGHSDEVWGLAMHPTHLQFLTCGYDKNVYLWDALSHTVVWGTELTDPAHCCCFHPDLNIAAVGLQNGRWLALDLSTRDVIVSNTDGNEQIEAIRFSPDGRLLAIGSRDNRIYLYKVNVEGTEFSRAGRCSGHSSFITHLDWSADSQYLRSNSGDYEVLFWTASDGKQVSKHATLKDVQWASQTCTLSFTVAGIWPQGADGTDINACSRSNNELFVATADDFGKVNLFTFPCSQPKSAANSFKGHSSHVTNVSFTPDDTRLITTGGNDTAVLQWAVV